MGLALKDEVLSKRRDREVWVYGIEIGVKDREAKRKSKRTARQQQKKCINHL